MAEAVAGDNRPAKRVKLLVAWTKRRGSQSLTTQSTMLVARLQAFACPGDLLAVQQANRMLHHGKDTGTMSNDGFFGGGVVMKSSGCATRKEVKDDGKRKPRKAISSINGASVLPKSERQPGAAQ